MENTIAAVSRTSTVKDFCGKVAVSVAATLALQGVAATAEKFLGEKERTISNRNRKLRKSFSVYHECIAQDDRHLADEEFVRILSLFVSRYQSIVQHGEKVLTYKDILCTLGEELDTLSAKLSGECRAQTKGLIASLDKFASEYEGAEQFATEIYRQIVEGGAT